MREVNQWKSNNNERKQNKGHNKHFFFIACMKQGVLGIDTDQSCWLKYLNKSIKKEHMMRACQLGLGGRGGSGARSSLVQ